MVSFLVPGTITKYAHINVTFLLISRNILLNHSNRSSILIFLKRVHPFHMCRMNVLQNSCSTYIKIFGKFYIHWSPYLPQYKAHKYNLCLINKSWAFSLHPRVPPRCKAISRTLVHKERERRTIPYSTSKGAVKKQVFNYFIIVPHIWQILSINTIFFPSPNSLPLVVCYATISTWNFEP